MPAPPQAHSDYVLGPISLHGYETDVDVMIESKRKERALLAYRWAGPRGGWCWRAGVVVTCIGQ